MPSGNSSPAIDPAMPAGRFLADVVARRGEALDRALRAAGRADYRKPKSERTIHQLRVACRRAAAALDAIEPLVSDKRTRPALKAIRVARNAAGPVRDADVLLHWIERSRRTHPTDRPGLKLLARELRDAREEALTDLAGTLKDAREKLGKRVGRLVNRLTGKADDRPSTIAELAGKVLELHADAVLAAAAQNLRSPEHLHALRIECKRLRYAIEVFAPALGRKASRRLLAPLTTFQQQVGAFTDCSVRADRIAAVLKRMGTLKERAKRDQRGAEAASLKGILLSQRAECSREHRAAHAAWKTLLGSTLFDDLRRLVYPASHGASATRAREPERAQQTVGVNGSLPALAGGRKPTAKALARRGKRRVAAIDIGTNSIRLIVGEAEDDGSYRVLDDEKEITRLGRGLHDSGRLDPDTQEHSAVTIARMKSIAEGYGAKEIRVVATAACREARNADEFLRLVRERSGLEVEVIPAEQEALLAYRSAAGAFDLAGAPAAVVDIGGGSLEVVFSAGLGSADARGAGLGGGVIERVFSLPLGAVRLTEQFGGATAAAGKRHRELTRFVEATLRKQMGKPPFATALVVGTGGTFTTLATMLAHREMGPAAQGLFSGSVQGREVRRSEIRHLLDHLRDLSLRDRTRVPGLPADRADIIVAGLTVIDCLLQRLGANSVLVHEGGIRDGLLLSMVQCARADGAPAADRGNPLRGVMRFARACQYEATHAKHVARLSLRIFDQLVDQCANLPQPVAAALSPRDRVLLEAAAILHDVGYLVNYASHHKHSYHLIVHADLPGLTSREIKVVANVARYHRAAEPKERHRNLAELSEADRQRVGVLAAILRIADGLDRTHMQRVRDVQLRLSGDAAHFVVVADEEPAVDIWGAIRKARLFERTFGLLPHLEWRGSAVGGESKPQTGTTTGESR